MKYRTLRDLQAGDIVRVRTQYYGPEDIIFPNKDDLLVVVRKTLAPAWIISKWGREIPVTLQFLLQYCEFVD